MSFYNAGVDFATFTMHPHDVGKELLGRLSTMAERYAVENEVRHEVKSLGYTGTQVGQLYYGSRPDSFIMRASSVAAIELFDVVRGEPVKPTRMDTQVTLIIADAGNNYARQAARNAVDSRDYGIAGTRRRVRSIDGYGDGDSVYVGSRSSESYGRIYDKHAESAGEYPPGAWRFEVEWKGSQAVQIMAGLLEYPVAEHYCRYVVAEWFERRGIVVPDDTECDAPLPRTSHAKSDDRKKLEWVEKQVAPAIKYLIKKGYRKHLLTVLGFDVE